MFMGLLLSEGTIGFCTVGTLMDVAGSFVLGNAHHRRHRLGGHQHTAPGQGQANLTIRVQQIQQGPLKIQ
jgi:hypothetical protein